MRKTFAAMMFLALTVSTNALASLPVGVTMGVLLDIFETKANNIIDNANYATNGIVNNGAFNVLSAVAQVRSQYEDVLNKTSAELTVQQRTLFEGLDTSINNFFNNLDAEHDKIDDTLDNLAVYLSDTMFMGGEPRISRFLSSIGVNSPSQPENLVVKFKGKNLNHKRNELHALGSDFDPSEMADNALTFLVPRDLILANVGKDGITLIPIELEVHKKGLLFSTTKTYRYLIRVLPNVLAKVSVIYDEPRRVVAEEKSKTAGGPTGRASNGLLGGQDCKRPSMTVYPDEGFRVVASSAHTDWHGSNNCSGRNSRCSVNPSPSVVYGECIICTQSNPNVNCTFSISTTFMQQRIADRIQQHSSEDMPVSFDAPATFSIPHGMRFNHVRLTYFNGHAVVLEKGGKADLVKAAVDPVTGTVVVSQDLKVSQLQ